MAAPPRGRTWRPLCRVRGVTQRHTPSGSTLRMGCEQATLRGTPHRAGPGRCRPAEDTPVAGWAGRALGSAAVAEQCVPPELANASSPGAFPRGNVHMTGSSPGSPVQVHSRHPILPRTLHCPQLNLCPRETRPPRPLPQPLVPPSPFCPCGCDPSRSPTHVGGAHGVVLFRLAVSLSTVSSRSLQVGEFLYVVAHSSFDSLLGI